MRFMEIARHIKLAFSFRKLIISAGVFDFQNELNFTRNSGLFIPNYTRNPEILIAITFSQNCL